jgi:hypothetical protein
VASVASDIWGGSGGRGEARYTFLYCCGVYIRFVFRWIVVGGLCCFVRDTLCVLFWFAWHNLGVLDSLFVFSNSLWAQE